MNRFNPSMMIFLIFLLMGSIIVISSHSWLATWMGFEINLLAFIPLISNSSNIYSTEAALQYFLVQALGSIIFLFILLTTFIINNFFLNPVQTFKFFIILPIALKMGASPFHQWFPQVLDGLHWTESFILMTWQKLAPMSILHFLAENNILLFSLGIISILVGSVGGINQTSLRKIMAYSSINHIGWMVISCTINFNLWLMYFVLYSFLNFSIILIFYHLNLSQCSQLCHFNMNPPLIIMTFLNLLSLGGMPPFLGFLPKWLIIEFMGKTNNLTFLILVMVCSSLITLFFYIRLTLPALTLAFSHLKNQPSFKNLNHKILFYITSLITLMGLILIPIIPTQY